MATKPINGSARTLAVVGIIIAAVTPTLAAITLYFQAKAAQVQTASLVATANKTADKTEELVKKADEIHTLTNSNLAKVSADLGNANERIQANNERIAGLQALVERMLNEKQSATTRPKQ